MPSPNPPLVFWALDPADFGLAGARQVLDQAVRHPDNPVLAPRPGQWDGTRCKVYGTVLFDEDRGRFRMWYSGGNDTPEAIRRECGAHRHVGYAESADGVHWERPALGLVEYEGSRDNNILILDAQAPSVLRWPGDPEHRWLMLVEAGQRTQDNRALASPDGLHWRKIEDNPLDPVDRERIHEPFSILYDPLDPDPGRRWKGYSLLHSYKNGYRGRSVGLHLGPDPLHWREHGEQPILDAATGLESEIHLPHVSLLHGRYVMLYDAMEPWHDTQTEIALSRDGLHFERVQNGVPVVPRGGPGEPDGAMVCVSPRGLFEHDGRLWWYYTASANNYQTCPRGGRGEPWYRYTCLAQWRQDGFAHLAADGDGGCVETAPFILPAGGLLECTANAVSGGCRVELLGQDGQALALGALPAGDYLAAAVEWCETPLLGAGRPCRLRLHLAAGDRLYAVHLPQAERTAAAPEPVTVPRRPARPGWACQAGGKITAEPLVDEDRVYVGSWDEHFHCLDPATGREIWRFQAENAIVAGAARLGELVFFGSRDGNVSALDRHTGAEVWRQPVAGGPAGSPNPNGPWVECPPALGLWRPDWGDPPEQVQRLFIGSHHRRLLALNPADGSRCFEFPTFNWLLGRPAVAGYTVYFGSLDGWLYAVDAAAGGLVWRYRTGQELAYAPAVVPGSVGTKAVTAAPLLAGEAVIVGGHDGFLHAVHARTGERLWATDIGDPLPAKAALLDDTVVVASNRGLVAGVSLADGALRWQRDLGETVHAAVVPLPGGCLVATARGRLLQLDESGEVISEQAVPGRIRATPATVPGGVVVVTIEGEVISSPLPPGEGRVRAG